MDFPKVFACKSGRGLSRNDDSKVQDTYKLPHRLIEKKRRDRINECISQLKELLPEHLKLMTLGHLEKAVVLELTLKHMKELTALTDQQHRRLSALQGGQSTAGSAVQADIQGFHMGFHACAKEVLLYLSQQEKWGLQEAKSTDLMTHLQHVAFLNLPQPRKVQHQHCKSEGSPTTLCPALLAPVSPVPVPRPCSESHHQGVTELIGSDTDTDSGYGGEVLAQVKREPEEEEEEDKYTREEEEECMKEAPKCDKLLIGGPYAKRFRTDASSRYIPKGTSLQPPPLPQQSPLCMPFYLFHPATAAAVAAGYVPLPFLYPRLPPLDAFIPLNMTAQAPCLLQPGASPSEGL
uniref:class E basic helix-loop-helix protein 41-like n=1 Tax=Myxine glutinosa TaxID=7769 RepID=UPI00358E6405